MKPGGEARCVSAVALTNRAAVLSLAGFDMCSQESRMVTSAQPRLLCVVESLHKLTRCLAGKVHMTVCSHVTTSVPNTVNQ